MTLGHNSPSALPFLPTLPTDDTEPDNPEGSLRLAVAFDVLATETRKIMVKPEVLEKLACAMLALRDSTQALQEAMTLLELARGPVGRARARLRIGLDEITATPRPLAPIARVHHFLALVDQAAELLVRKEILYIQSRRRPHVAKA